MEDSAKPSQNSIRQTYLALAVFLIGFMLVLDFRRCFSAFDMSINIWVQSIQSSLLTNLALAVSFAFDTYSLLIVSLGIAAYVFFKNYKIESLLFLGAMAGEALTVSILKSLVQSPRPPNGLLTETSFSFPSGHVMGSIVFCGLLAYFAWQHWKATKPRSLTTFLAVITVSIVSFDRVYLNVHWFSDVLGGCLLGIAWLCLAILIMKSLKVKFNFSSQKFNSLAKILFILGIVVGLIVLNFEWVTPSVFIGSFVGFIHYFINTASLITSVGYIGLFIIVFAESGLFVGFFLPGDSLLFTAGLLCSSNLFNIFIAVGIVVAGAIFGDSFGYAFGRKVGPLLLKKPSRILTKKRVDYVVSFYEHHGTKAIFLARFVPVARTFAPILAGTSKMKYGLFLAYNILGGVTWGLSLSLLGFYLGKAFPNIQFFILPIAALIIIISVLPWVIKILADKLHKKSKDAESID